MADKARDTAMEIASASPVQLIDVSMIHADAKLNSRQTTGMDKDSIAELAGNIRQHGQLQPVVVRPSKQGFELVAGFRRMAAIKFLNRKTIEAKVLDSETTEQQGRILNLVENMMRGDLSTYEKAHALTTIEQSGVKRNEMAARLGMQMSESTINNLMRCYRELDPRIKAYWADPNSKVRAHLSMQNLLAIVSKPIQAKEGEPDQQTVLNEVMHEANPDAVIARLKAGAKGAGGATPKGTSPIVRLKKKLIEAAIGKIEEFKMSEDTIQGYVIALTWVKHGAMKNLLSPNGEVIFNPEDLKPKKATKVKGGKKTKAKGKAKKAA